MFKDSLKALAYKTGLLPAYHTLLNRRTLTVVLFHRVLPVTDPRWECAEDEWTVSDTFFESCLKFFREHYNIVTMQQVLDSEEKLEPLPNRALLITFDDGWSDNLQIALPIIKKHEAYPILFVTTQAIGKRMLSWQETLYSNWKIGTLQQQDLDQINRLTEEETPESLKNLQIHSYIAKLQKLDGALRGKIREYCDSMAARLPGPDHMLSKQDLIELYNNQIEIGTHGLEHEPLTQADDSLMEGKQAMLELQTLLNGRSHSPSMSFPLGRKSPQLIRQMFESGYQSVFTGDECLNQLPQNGKHPNLVLGRLNIAQPGLSDAQGHLKPELLALHLFRRPHKKLS